MIVQSLFAKNLPSTLPIDLAAKNIKEAEFYIILWNLSFEAGTYTEGKSGTQYVTMIYLCHSSECDIISLSVIGDPPQSHKFHQHDEHGRLPDKEEIVKKIFDLIKVAFKYKDKRK